jgi:hypothetical protein
MLRIAALLAGLAAVGAAPPAANSEKIFQALSFTAQEQARLRQGEIVSHGVQELSDKELAITMAVLVPAPLTDLIAFARSEKELEINREILAHGVLADDAGPASLKEVRFAPSESSEIRGLYEAGPGSRFNLSASEVQRFADLRRQLPEKSCEKSSRCAEAVMAAYQEILWDRLKAYRERGLGRIDPYVRENGRKSDPAQELLKATNAAQFLAREYPRIFDAFLRYPGGDQSGIESRFLWIKQKVQDRPTFILAHRILYAGDEVAFMAERQFYVGQSYNSLQILSGLLPMEGKTLVVYLNRTSTDQVAGFMSDTRHGMGRRIMEKEIRRHFEEVLAAAGWKR